MNELQARCRVGDEGTVNGARGLGDEGLEWRALDGVLVREARERDEVRQTEGRESGLRHQRLRKGDGELVDGLAVGDILVRDLEDAES